MMTIQCALNILFIVTNSMMLRQLDEFG
jgi:hypothetical protein